MPVYRRSQVFIAGGQPTVTYNPRTDLNLDKELREYLHTRHKVMTVTGPTKSGKTVLVRRVVPKRRATEPLTPDTGFWVSGGQVPDATRFWETIVEQAEAFTTTSVQEEQTEAHEKTYSVEGGVKPFGIGMSHEGGFSDTDGHARGQRQERTVSVVAAALRALTSQNRPLVIDDFHYIPALVRREIVRSLKEPVFDGLPVILIAVPHRAFDVVRDEKEMTGRVAQLEVPMWKPHELAQIATSGFNALNVESDSESVDRMVRESFSSPHLMQDFCGKLCGDNDVDETVPDRRKLLPPPDWEPFFRARAKETAKPQFDRLKIGPKERTDRKARLLHNGKSCDIYEAVLLAIAHTGPRTELRHRELMTSIKEVLADDVPEGHEVTRVLDQMTRIAHERGEGGEDPDPVVDYDNQFSTLHITDPFFAFYLRWGTDLENAGR